MVRPPSSRIDAKILADALRDVLGEEAAQSLRDGPMSTATLVRRLMANPATARELIDAVTVYAVKRGSEREPPFEFGPVATDNGTYEESPPMFGPFGSVDFEAAVDAMANFNEKCRQEQRK